MTLIINYRNQRMNLSRSQYIILLKYIVAKSLVKVEVKFTNHFLLIYMLQKYITQCNSSSQSIFKVK